MSNQFSQDHYAMFGLPRRYALDIVELERVYRELLTRVHPDKHVNLGDAEQRQAMQLATQANEAYQTLRRPLQRAQYLLQLCGVDAQLEHNTAMPAEFLMQQMAWREAVEEARSAGDSQALEDMHRHIKQQMAEQFRQLDLQFDSKPDYLAACATVRQMMFQEKLLHEIDDALAVLEI